VSMQGKTMPITDSPPGYGEKPKSDFDYLNDQITQVRAAMWREVNDLRDRVRDNRARVAKIETAAQRDLTHDCSTEKSATVEERGHPALHKTGGVPAEESETRPLTPEERLLEIRMIVCGE